jgi:hypothetical protein
VWAQANPGLGIRISHEWVEQERTVEMGARGFAVERLSVGDWPDTSEDAGRVLTSLQWKAIGETDTRKRIVGDKTYAIDVNPDRTWGSIGVGGQRDDDLWHMAVVEHQRGTGWIVERCKLLDGPVVVDTKGPAANLIDDLREAGVEVIEADASDYGQACSDFYDLAVDRLFRHPDPSVLDEAVADARKQSFGDAWKWSRKNSTSADITPLVACTLALWGARTGAPVYTTVIYGSDETPATSEPVVGVREPTVLAPEEVTSCLACRIGGCTIHA